MISESEIPLAILHCSVDKYCNPKFKFVEFLKRAESKPDSSKILVLDTQNVLPDVIELPQVISNVPVNSVVVNSKHEVAIIPESLDSNYEILNNDNTCQQQQTIKSSRQKKNQEKQDARNCNTSDIEGTVENVQKINVTKYIPETNDLSVSDVTQKDTQCSTQVTQDLKIQNIESFDVSVIAGEETPFNEVIDLTKDESIESIDKQLNKDECNKTLNILLTQEKLDKLLGEVNVRDKSSEINLLERHNTLLPTKGHKRSLELGLDTLEENNKRSKKRNKHSNDVESEEDYLSTSKKIYIGNSNVEDTVESSCIVRLLFKISLYTIDKGHNTNETFSFLIFRKITTIIVTYQNTVLPFFGLLLVTRNLKRYVVKHVNNFIEGILTCYFIDLQQDTQTQDNSK